MAENITIKIATVKLTSKTDEYAISHYDVGVERYIYQASIMAYDVSNPRKTYIFTADNLKMRVSTGGPVACVSFTNEGDFIKAPENYVVGCGLASGDAPTLKYSSGDVITIRATVKNGRLTRVKIA